MEDLKRIINEIIEDKNTMHGTSYQETLKEIKKTIEEIEKEYQEQEQEERREKILYINSIYDEYLQKIEKRGLSYGELSYIENLSVEELEELENEILKELEKLEKEAKKAD